jgi:NAD(P)H-flavin reductase
VLILVGGLLNKAQPGFVQPKGPLGSLFHKRLGNGVFFSQVPIQIIAVICVLAFYGARFYGSFLVHYSTEAELQELYPTSNGAARAIALALHSVWLSMVLVQISLGVKHMFWFILTGLPVERAARYHELHGYLLAGVHVAEWICFAIGGLTYRPLLAPFCTCSLNPIAGIISLVCNVMIVFTSLPMVRRKNWDMFYLMGHFQLIPMISLSALLHDRVNFFPWLVAAFAMWGYSDIPLRAYMKVMQHTKVIRAESKGGCAVLTLTKATPSGRATLGLLQSRWEAGSYVWIAVRAPGVNPLKGKVPPPFNQDWACYHPITIATPPIAPDGQPAKDFTLVIKSMGAGTWSEAVTKKAQSGVPASDWKVWIGGPNGKLSFAPEHCDKVVLVAGGIGCTPMMAMALNAHRRKQNPPVTFLWVIRSAELLDAFESTLAELKDSPVVTLSIYCTSAADVEKNGFVGIKGRPDFIKVLSESGAGMAGVVGVYSCGPKSMMESVAATVASIVSPSQYLLHEETFEL